MQLGIQDISTFIDQYSDFDMYENIPQLHFHIYVRTHFSLPFDLTS